MAKRIMRKFKLSEISVVDRPAQAHARALIMKRHEGLDAMNDDISADEAILESVRSILEDDELDDDTRASLLVQSVEQYAQYVVATGSTLDDPQFGGPDELQAKITAVTKAAVEGDDVAFSAVVEHVGRAFVESKALPGESVTKARSRFWQSPAGHIFMEAAKRAPKGETAQQRRNRLKRERAERDGPPSRSAPMQNLHKHAAERFPTLTVSQAVAKIAISSDPADQELWNAAKNAA
jgi:hypothetical protein